jgi:hypothetical protein
MILNRQDLLGTRLNLSFPESGRWNTNERKKFRKKRYVIEEGLGVRALLG